MATNESWDHAHKLTSKIEGGIASSKKDLGNQNTVAGVTMYSKTYYGLTLEAYADMEGLTYPPASKKDFKTLNGGFVKAFGGTTNAPVSSADGKNKVKALFKEAYWDKHKLGDITDKRVAASIYDALVNQGWSFGDKGQRNSSMLGALKRLGIDTSNGFKDLNDAIKQVNAAIADPSIGGDKVLDSYAQSRENSYIKSTNDPLNPDRKEASRGWMNRLNDHRTDTSKVDWEKLPKDTALSIDSINKVRINTDYDIVTATSPGDSTELTQEQKDKIAVDIQPTPAPLPEDIQPTPAPLPEDAPNVISQIEIDKDNARRKQEEENKKKEGVYQPKELIPLSDLSSEEIDALTGEERKQYGLQPKITEEDKAAQIEKERLEAEELEKEKELHSKEQQLKKEAEEKKKREQRKARDKVVDKDGDGIPDTIDADAGEPAPEGQETVSTEEQGVIEEQEKESAIETVETEEIEVLDANGNIKKITVPTVTTPTTPTTVETESTTEQVIEEKPELVKPKFKDFKTSSDYVRARMKYFKSIEDEGGENTVDFDNELDDDEIKEAVDMEQNSTVIDSSKRNIFKTNGKTNIFNSILGAVDDIGKGIQQELNNITKSINNKQ
tara:strand:+ start:511 stop:2346 length:1836 start_codon:yes stop_codon:yes gene_type:complete